MTEPSLMQRQRVLLAELYQLSGERAQAEMETETRRQTALADAEQLFQSTKQNVEARFESEKKTADREYENAKLKITIHFETDDNETKKDYAATIRHLESEFETSHAKTKKEYEEAQWTVAAVLEATKTELEKKYKETSRGIAELEKKRQASEDRMKQRLQEWRQRSLTTEVKEEAAEPAAVSGRRLADVLKELHGTLAQAAVRLERLEHLRLPGFFVGLRPLGAIVALLIPALAAAWFLSNSLAITLTSGVIATVLAIGAIVGLYSLARSQVRRVSGPLSELLRKAADEVRESQAAAKANYEKRDQKSHELHDNEQLQIDNKFPFVLGELKRRYEADRQQADETFPPRLTEIKNQFDDAMKATEEKYRLQCVDIRQRHEHDLSENQSGYDRQTADARRQYEHDWQSLIQRWRQRLANAMGEVEVIRKEANGWFPSWEDDAWKRWTPPTAVPPIFRFGDYAVAMSQVPHGVPDHSDLQAEMPKEFRLPALVPFPQGCSMLFEAADDGRAKAIDALQAVMLRLLVSNPPGKVRFTIIDPVGLGENFAAFMHLTDYDEALVGSRIWTEAEHIEIRLADMTAHMENVIQKYLRNQYQSIEEYNAEAGEVAEPFRVLVAANFPANFSVDAARRLLSIAGSGARCGVYTLVTVDMKQTLPVTFDLRDLEQACTILRWHEDRFVWADRDFEKYPLRLDAAPGDEFVTKLLHQVGKKAKDANRVEVPFEFVVPPAEQWWTSDSRSGISVALGRAGATKRQYLQLGKGTSQHVLVAGKTGSGKSTLLHALIVNLALNYSPDEIELYLIDFKKGVEFKAYATHQLPHARVIAIESEREFGLSVLQRLDAELKQRGERFRTAGVHDISAYRQMNPGAPGLPRVMLIVDEFQEFFVEDDKIARDTALLLDRLVRQGRAFGIHVMLGSQTLGGAYNPARSTIDQMAVRIALQCSETDAHLILSADNPAARLLSRPGEAIYNDANGLIEGNDIFQVVWLPEERKEHYLNQIQRRAGVRPPVNGPPIIFEGNAPADVRKNHLLRQSIITHTGPHRRADASRSPVAAWLGEAVAIKDPTAAVFRRQSGSNLLVVGQQGEAALGVLATAVVSIASQVPTARFHVLDGTPADDPNAGLYARLAEILPERIQVAGPRDTPTALAQLNEEAERRQTSSASAASNAYLIIHGLQRFRDLRRQEDDFGFSRQEGDRPNPSKLLATILREGASLGIHTLVWCDTLNNLNRSMDRQTLREFEQRVLFQMSADDSSNLIDTPLAGKLGLHRALYYSEELGIVEKFRPYGVPADEWLAWIRESLLARHQSSV